MNIFGFSFPSTKKELNSLPSIGVASLVEAIKPRELPGIVVTEGDKAHEHRFVCVEWDRERLGPDMTDFDEDPGTEIAFPLVTYKELHRCMCGREIVSSTRALI